MKCIQFTGTKRFGRNKKGSAENRSGTEPPAVTAVPVAHYFCEIKSSLETITILLSIYEFFREMYVESK